MSGVETEREIKREHDSVDDFEHLEHDVQELRPGKSRAEDPRPVGVDIDAIAQPCPREMEDPKEASLLLVHAETSAYANDFDPVPKRPEKPEVKPEAKIEAKAESKVEEKPVEKVEKGRIEKLVDIEPEEKVEATLEGFAEKVEEKDIRESVLPVPEKSPTLDFLGDAGPPRRNVDDTWNVVERNVGPSRPLNTSPQDSEVNTAKSETVSVLPSEKTASKLDKPEKVVKVEKIEKIEKTDKPERTERMEKAERTERVDRNDRFEMSNDFVFAEAPKRGQGSETGESEFESEAEASPARTSRTNEARTNEARTNEARRDRIEEIEIAPKEIFKSMGIDAWFNPERLNPKVAALIYWREPRKSGIVFTLLLAVLLSLASTSLISVLAYISLLVLTATVGIRIYKTVLQAVQKTSDGHPFKDALSLDLTLPSEKVHQVADVAVAHANAAVGELRRLFLVEDFVDSVKFGVLLWCLTYVGSWFNGLTLIIIGVVALFTLPKVYETNKAQIDQNLALVQGKINELTAKVRAAIPLGKKPEPTKEE